MSAMTIDIPEKLLAGSHLSRAEFLREARLAMAAKLFDLGRLSSGRAAELCGLSRVDFLLEASKLGVSPIQLDEEDYAHEFAPL
jgi:predicted HTH domain antitoxin